MKERQGIFVNSMIKLRNIKTGVDDKSRPYWTTSVGLTTFQSGSLATYAYITLKMYGKCEFMPGDWVKVTEITGFNAKPKRNSAGAITIYETLFCAVERAIFDN